MVIARILLYEQRATQGREQSDLRNDAEIQEEEKTKTEREAFQSGSKRIEWIRTSMAKCNENVEAGPRSAS